MNLMDFEIKSCEANIKVIKNLLRMSYGTFFLNIFLVGFALCCSFLHTSLFLAIIIGAAFMNSVWLLGLILEIYRNMKLDIDRIKQLKEYQENEMLDGAINQHHSARKLYEEALEQLGLNKTT